MKRVLLVYSVPDGAGAQRMMTCFAHAFRDAGFHVVVAYGDSTARSHELPEAARRLLTGLEHRDIPCVPLHGFRQTYSSQLQKKIVQLVHQHHIDALVCFHPLDMKYALRIAGLTKKPCVVSLQNRQVFWGSPLMKRLKAYVFRRLIRRYATSIVCTSQVLKEDLITNYGAAPEKCCVIPNGIPLEQSLQTAEQSQLIRRKLGVRDDRVLMANTGRLDIQKGQDILLQSLARVSDDCWELLLIGDTSKGRSDTEVNAYAQNLLDQVDQNRWADRVHFLGWRDDVREILAAADFYVHAARWEGPAAPLAVMEAMAAGRPVVVTDCSGRLDGFHDGTHGFVVPSESPAALSDAVQKMLTFPRQRLWTMGASCRDYAEQHFDIHKIGSAFVEQVDRVICQSRVAVVTRPSTPEVIVDAGS